MLSKLLLTLLVILVVGYGLRWLGAPPAEPEANDPNRDTGRSDTNLIDDMEQCSACNTWVTSSDAKACGRKDCPYS